jgi:ribosome-associated toxin RatA of RatAB toxin-antitoxin module
MCLSEYYSHFFEVKTTVLAALWCGLLALLWIVLPHCVEATGSDAEWQDLLAGEVLTTPVRNVEGLPGVRAMFTVTASRQRIWSVLVDYRHFPQIFPALNKLRVLSQDAQGARVEYWANAAFLRLHYVLYRHYIEPGRRLTWSRVAGDLKRIEGFWEIRDTPRPDVHLLVYESYVQVGSLVPTTLVRQSALRKAQEMGERLRAWIEGRVATN